MSGAHRRIAIATVMSASLLTGLAVADTTVATTPEDTIVETSVTAATSPENAGVEVLPPDASYDGLTRAEWTARAWQWWLSLPTDVNPSETSQGCGYGQAGPVYFLPFSADN